MLLQVSQVILNLPNSMAKCGMGLGVLFQLICASAAVYTLWLLSALYQEYKRASVSVAVLTVTLVYWGAVGSFEPSSRATYA